MLLKTLHKFYMPCCITKIVLFFRNSCSLNEMQQGKKVINENYNCCLGDSWIEARKYTAHRHKPKLQWDSNLACPLF